jgi:fibronectin type 3 domain-containing protein
VARELRALTILLVAAFALGCANETESLAERLFERDQPLVFDRGSNLLPPEGLRVTSNQDRQIALAWDPVLVGDVAGYAILRAKGNGDEPYVRVGITKSRFGTVFSDTGASAGALGDGQTYTYRIHPYDSHGRISRSHAALLATTEPKPEVPDGLQVYSNLPRSAVLSWKPSDATAVSGYAIYRCPTMAGPWERVTFVPGRLNTVYEDTVPGDLRVMYYRIAAVNRFGGESEPTEQPIRAVTKAEPLPPIGLQASAASLGRADLHWSPNVEPDLASYEVWRALANGSGYGEEVQIAQVPAGTTELADSAIGCGESARYRLRATDADALVSLPSEPLELKGADAGLSLARRDGVLIVSWDPARAGDWTGARVAEVRSALPDREVAIVTQGNEVALPELGAGAEIRVTFLRTGVAGTALEAPPCRLIVP